MLSSIWKSCFTHIFIPHLSSRVFSHKNVMVMDNPKKSDKSDKSDKADKKGDKEKTS